MMRAFVLYVCERSLLYTHQIGDISSSIRCLQRASVIDPTHPIPYLNAARTLLQLGNTMEAQKHLSQALRLDDQLSMIYIDMGQADITANEISNGINNFEK